MPKMIAVRTHTYAGKVIKTGDQYEATPEDAKVLSIIGHSRIFTEAEAAEVKPKKRNEYKHRKLEAED